jgi:hypothetical protein
MQKCKKNPLKTHFGNIGISNLRFFSIALKFGPQVHNDFLVTNAIAKLKKNQKIKSYSTMFLNDQMKETFLLMYCLFTQNHTLTNI